MLSTNALAAGFCIIGEFNILDKEAFNRLSEKNYTSFSEGITPASFPNAPNHFSAEPTDLSEAKYLYNNTSSLLEVGPESSVVSEAEEASRLLSSIGRTASKMGGAVALEILGPIGDAVAVGLYRNVVDAFEDESRTSYDRFQATVMELVDWFGVLKLPQRSIDRHILVNRWNNMAAGDHYSFTIHDDIVTRQDLRDKKHWASLAANQHKTIETVVKKLRVRCCFKISSLLSRVSKGSSTSFSNMLITAVDRELNKTLSYQLGINKNGKRV